MVRSTGRHDAAQPQRAVAPVPGAPQQTGLLNLQRSAGNAAVTQHVQRYAVGVPGTSDHATLMGWLTASNPYAPDSAAKTSTKFTYSVAWSAKGEPGSWTVTPKDGAAVALAKSVDMPVWVAKDAKLQAAWSAGVTALRAHEKSHEDLADTWKTNLQGRLTAFTMTSTAANETVAGKEASAQLATEWAGWLGEAQAAQDALDPYAVVVTDPYPRAAPAAPPAPAAPTPDADSEGSE